MPMTQENATWFADTFSKIVENVGLALLGKEEIISLQIPLLLLYHFGFLSIDKLKNLLL